jgi:multidrug efflux pump subunit AcrB
VGSIYVRSDKGEMVPVRSIANIQYVSGPDTLERFNNLPAVTVLGSGAPGRRTGQALEKIEKVAKEVLPSDFSFDWSGASLQEKRSGGTSIIALVAGAFMAFLILAAQYERWSLPLSVMLALARSARSARSPRSGSTTSSSRTSGARPSPTTSISRSAS